MRFDNRMVDFSERLHKKSVRASTAFFAHGFNFVDSKLH